MADPFPAQHVRYPKMATSTVKMALPAEWESDKVAAVRPRKGGRGAAAWADALRAAKRTRKKGLRGVWVVTEKLHGANLCLVAERGAGGVRAARRGGFLDFGREEFFGCAPVVEAASGPARRALEWAAENCADGGAGVTAVRVYGELVGGAYPHPDADAPPEGHMKPVQREVYYSPGLRFVAFDILVERGGGEPARFLDCDDFYAAAAACGLECALPLLAGPLRDALAHTTEFATRQPAAWGLPPIDGNLAEGVVVRSAVRVEPARVRGEERRSPWRAIFKRKSPGFLECARVGVARATLGGVLEAAVACVTPHRVASTVGKLGSGVPAARLARAVADDVLQDLAAGEAVPGGAEAWRALPKAARGEVERALLKRCEGAVAGGAAAL